MEHMIEVRGVSFTYASRTRPSLLNIDLQVPRGDFLLITGSTGCGKSTLLKMFNGLIPHACGGTMTGEVQVRGQSIHASPVAELSKIVGVMFQSPDDQIFSATAADEVAFILQNQGMEAEAIEQEVKLALAVVGLAGMENASVHALSGGQKQRLALAAILVARPEVLVLDEPISQLDPQGAQELLAVIYDLNQQHGMTVIIVEHRLHEVLPLCRHVAIMDQGQLVWQGTREQAFHQAQVFVRYGLRLPHTVDLCRRLGIKSPGASVTETVAVIQNTYGMLAAGMVRKWKPGKSIQAKMPQEQAIVEICDVGFQYEPKGRFILNKINLRIFKGQFIALMGKNGAGKSTLLQIISGLAEATAGQVSLHGKPLRSLVPEIGLVLQNPDLMLFNLTVEKELLFVLKQRRKLALKEEILPVLIQNFGLARLEQDFPLALSRGQRFRVAIAAALAVQPEVLLLDEPTTGQDIGHIRAVAQILKEYVKQGGTVVFCTHDTEVAAEYADRILVMQQGDILADTTPAELFCDEDILQAVGIRPPQITQLAKLLYSGSAVTVEEVAAYVRQNAVGTQAQ